MGLPSLIGAEAAREVIDYVKRRKARPENDVSPRSRWPLADSAGSASWVRVSNATLNGAGYYPGFVETFNPATKVWSDGDACQVGGPNSEVLPLGRYLGLNMGVAGAPSLATYIITLGSPLTVEYSDGTMVQTNISILRFAKNDFVIEVGDPAGTSTIFCRGLTGTYQIMTGVTCSATGITPSFKTATSQDGLTQSVL